MWGMTVDEKDWMFRDRMFPLMKEGEWLLYRNSGAYNDACLT
jgi:diaminopimelate decarboxylase